MSNSFEYNLLNAAFNSVMNDRNFVTEKEFKDTKARHEIGNVVYENIEINSFHQYNLVGGKAPSKHMNNNVKIDMKIFLKTLSGESYILYCKGSHTIDRIKRKISEKKGIPPDRQKLIFNGCELKNGLTLADYNISNNSIIYFVRHLKGEESIISCLNSNDLDQTYNRDFTNVNDEGKIFTRGGFRYLRPCGWKRIAFFSEIFRFILSIV
ncbi:5876_t:CDS:1 [Dentiscutata heterogama]|uniref:5876_t:CDS:1 n=1 Tax=Dentiscutata heterogama TaxID=1316150 RepID=A0ACA9KK54_9GLOM|nr:5876_t:CDS:1 [Dentiscutata heterogama]